jgi:DNA-directed RNA polymerase specialized sigma24 family protein
VTLDRWTRKTVREYAPYTRWDWADPMHDALDVIAPSDCELFKRRYWDREPYDAIGETCGISGGRVAQHMARICDDIAGLME